MMLSETASIALSVISLAQTGSPLSAGVLTVDRRDAAASVVAATGAAIGMTVATMDMSRTRVADEDARSIASAVDAGRPTLFVLDRATDGKAVHDTVSAIRDRIGRKPCVVLALTEIATEKPVVAGVAGGMGIEASEVATYRTRMQNRLLVERVLEAMQ